MIPTARPVLGMLDWGIGGCSVLAALQAQGVDCEVLYASDSGAPPYGTLTSEALKVRVQRVAQALMVQGAEQVVVACNAASTVCEEIPLPLLSVIDAGVQAIQEQGFERVAVLGGQRTVDSLAYVQALSGVEVIQRVAQPLSALVEAGQLQGPLVRAAVAKVIVGLSQVDAVVLACTHYPALAPHFHALLPGVPLVDPGVALARRLGQGMASGSTQVRFYTSGDPAKMQAGALASFGVEIPSVGSLLW
ncbi:MAG: glutamate racemase [Cognaticolwellia sp.]|jgi:glutamate racemase